MAETTREDLNYGHPGAPSYDLDNSQWAFARQQTTRHFEQVRPWEDNLSIAPTLAIPAPTRFFTTAVPAYSTSVHKPSRDLIRKHPQLAPSADVLPNLALISAAIQKTAATYDPLVGDLLSFGSTTTRDLHDAPRRIAAIPTGETGSILRLANINRIERLSLGPNQSTWADGPTLKLAESGYWNEDAAPIQQLCFARSGDRNTILAVRLPTKTVLLRPRYYRRPQAAKPSQYYHLPVSLIDAHPILSLGIEETGGAAHVNVAFNPDYQLQLGIVDQNRLWSVWEIEHGRKGDTYTITRLVQGSIIPPEGEEPAGEDGWARLFWIGDINTVLVCCRRQLSVVNMKGDTFEYLRCPDIFPKRSLDWILDVRHHPRFKRRFFVLTSTFLRLMAVTTSSEALDSTVGPAGASILASWRHYRGIEDITLQISVQIISDDELCVILYSRLNHLVQVYSFMENMPDIAAGLVASNPVSLRLTLDSPGCISQLHMEPMQYNNTGDEFTSLEPEQLCLESSLRFYRLFATLSDLSVHELVISTYKTSTDSRPKPYLVQVFSQNILKHKRMVQKKEEVDEDDDFIVPAGLNIMDGPMTLRPCQTPYWAQTQDRISSYSGADYRLLYDALTWTENSPESSIDITGALDRIRQMLIVDQYTPSCPTGTLMDAAGWKLHVLDVDEASMLLQELIVTTDDYNSVSIERIASARVLNLTENQESTLADVYDVVLQNWIAPLSRDISVPVRQWKERIARRIAAESMLASMRIRHENAQLPVTGSQMELTQDDGIASSMLPSKPGSGQQNNTSPWSSVEASSIVPYSSLPSSSPPSSPPMLPSTPPARTGPISRLSQHLTIRDGFPTSATITPNVGRVLEHWSLGSDPSTYDWSAKEVTLREETLDESSQKKRERERKKRERRDQRQERENELMRSKSTDELMPFAQSSQGPILDGMGSSSQVPSQPIIHVPLPRHGFAGSGGMDILAPMSQVEPGRFGGRLDLKKKKKERLGGF